jgi:ankyrin repeat protein
VVSLPNDPTRELFDAKAEALLADLAGGNPDAQALWPGDPSAFTLDAARAVVAGRIGFSGWAALQTYLDIVDVYRRDNDPHQTTETIPDEFCRLACLTYTDDPPERRAAAREILGVHPDLTADHVWAAAAAADVDALRRLLDGNPSLANRDGGPYGWKPLHYLTYARHDSRVSEQTVITAARLLLRAGADPNAGYLWGGMQTPFTVLTGVFGEGEQGPGRCPRHPYAEPLAGLILTAGADPNDGQALYNRMFRPDNSHLELLFSFGLGTGDGGEWPARLGEAGETPRAMVDGQLDWAVKHGFAERVSLLIDHGVDVNRALRGGRTAAEVAAANGDGELVDILVGAGATRRTLQGLDAFVADCLAGDARAVAGKPELRQAAIAANPALIARAVEAGRIDAIPLLAELGFDVNARNDGETALHRAAWHGDIAVARVLLDAGADPTAIDDSFDATPFGWAEHGGQTAFMAFIAPLTGAAEPAQT